MTERVHSPWHPNKRYGFGEFQIGDDLYRLAGLDEAKHSGGMVALYPRQDYAAQLAIPNGEPQEELHLTLVFLGEDVGGMAPGPLIQSVSEAVHSYTVIDARVMGRAEFNHDGSSPDGPCAVYLIGDNPQLPDLHQDVLNAANDAVNVPYQHTPWVPHLTAGYGIDPRQLTYTGTVIFDRIGVAWAGDTHFLPLLGAN